MHMRFSRLFEQGNIGRMIVPNRIVMPGIGTHSGDLDGQMNERTIRYYEARAQGGVGLIITQGLGFTTSTFPRQIMINDDKFIPGLRQLVDRVHRHGARIVCQLSYSGVMAQRFLSNQETTLKQIEILGPSPVRCATYGTTPRAMTHEEIRDFTEKWSDSACRAKKVGFDGVEIHAAHGYFMSAFLSNYQNRRTDKYGGSLVNRSRFACEVLARTREKVGADFPILFRLNGCDFFEGGTKLEEVVMAAPMFVAAGADCMDVSAGNQESRQWRDLTYLFPDGAIVYTAEAIKKAVQVPVIAVGKIGTPELAESVLEDGKADFIAFGRPLLADPDFAKKSLEGRLENIHYCLFCNNCRLGHGTKALMEKKGAGLACTVNPALLRENEFQIRPVSKPKKVMVVGGGVAGMAAATVLKARGHAVTLYEKTARLGGIWNTVALDPKKSRFGTVTDYLMRELSRLHVPLSLQTEVTSDLVREVKPDAVVIAIGAVARRPEVPGIDGKNVVQATEVLTGKAQVGSNVVVVGGRLVGMEMAVMLAERGKKVSLVTMRGLGEDGTPPERNLFVVLRESLREKGVAIYTHSPVTEITERGVYFVWDKEMQFIKADTVVLAVGMKPDNRLFEELKGLVPELYAVGDCLEPRNALEAINEGAEVAFKI
ncbi:MAG: FAD-dependent oxidoreductase [Chloroflexi bacterium]|nr:FAD-dependent oxidoreductase [Chloroflexota bacterium]